MGRTPQSGPLLASYDGWGFLYSPKLVILNYSGILDGTCSLFKCSACTKLQNPFGGTQY